MESPLQQLLISSYKSEMIAYMHSHPQDFDEAIKLAISDRQPFSWRAAWLLWSCMEVNDLRFRLYINDILHALEGKKDGHQRELLKILFQMKLNNDQDGYLFDICVKVWEKINKKPSVRLTALKCILKIAEKHPELSQEVLFYTQDHYIESLSPGIMRSINFMLENIKGK